MGGSPYYVPIKLGDGDRRWVNDGIITSLPINHFERRI
jgi:hypothetical protein